MSSFTWLPFFEEMLSVICQRYNKKTLCNLIHKIFQETNSLNDKFADGTTKPLREVDPLTFIGFFNRQRNLDNKFKSCEIAKEKMGLHSDVPKDLDGIPRLNNRNSWFFTYSKTRKADDIDTIWEFSKKLNSLSIDDGIFRSVCNIKNIGIPKLTTVMFICKPNNFISLDSRNTGYLTELSFKPNEKLVNQIKKAGKPFTAYKQLVNEIENFFNSKAFYEISHDAYLNSPDKPVNGNKDKEKVNYWALFANPKIYDVETAIVNNNVETWTVKKSDIKCGDKIVFWRGLKEGKRGIVGLGEVISNPKNMAIPTKYNRYFVNAPLKGKEPRVWIKLYKSDKMPLWLNEDASGILKKLSVAKATGGTVFHVEPEQWTEIVNLLEGYKEDVAIPKEIINEIEEQEEQEAKKLPTTELWERAHKSVKKTKTRKAELNYYIRNPYVSEYAKRIAGGICQLCGAAAPFDNKNGDPYLESHHIVWLSKGGKDSINNCIALCPNCHKKMHILDLDCDKKKLNSIRCQ